jgi:hypothetical protein
MVAPLALPRAPGVWLAFASLAALAFSASVLAPLWTYTFALATFGSAHVLWELRYVGGRFGPRFPWAIWAPVGLGLLAVAGVRVARNLGDLASFGGEIELIVVALLALVPLPWLAREGLGRAAFGAGVAAFLGAGALYAPTETLLALAFLHNLTPIGFVAEALRGPERALALAGSAVIFLLAPAWIASGGAALALAPWAEPAPDWSWFQVGGLADQLGAWIPRAWHHERWAAHLFAAAVFSQCMHYLAVLGVLPLLQGDDQRHARWPFFGLGLLLAAGCLAFVGLYAWDFRLARSWYGPMAAVHAWLELPVLLTALGVGSASVVGPTARRVDPG